jgi:hypothetical protein
MKRSRLGWSSEAFQYHELPSKSRTYYNLTTSDHILSLGIFAKTSPVRFRADNYLTLV